MIVVDTNVIAYLYLSSGRSSDSEAALRRDPAWAAPLLWRSEMSNVLATYVREGRLARDDAIAIMDRALERMSRHEYHVSPPRVLALAAETNASAYDCAFAALAVDLGVPLVTADRGLAAAFGAVAIALDAYARGSS